LLGGCFRPLLLPLAKQVNWRFWPRFTLATHLDIAFFQIQRLHLPPQQHDHSLQPVIAGIRKLKTVSPAQFEAGHVVPPQAQACEGHRIIQKLHSFTPAGMFAGCFGYLASGHAVHPEPHQRAEQADQE
jgi:hypothetical protein